MLFELLFSVLCGLIVCIANRKNLNADAAIISFLVFLTIFVIGFLGNWIKITILLTIIFYYVVKALSDDQVSAAIGSVGFFTITTSLIVLISIGLPGTITIEEPVEHRNESLEVLRIGSSVQGHFFLGIGSVNSNEYYVYNYVKNSELLREKVPITRNVHIFIDDTVEKPFVRYYTIHQNKELSGITEFIYGKNHRERIENRIDFFIPSNSLAQGVYI